MDNVLRLAPLVVLLAACHVPALHTGPAPVPPVPPVLSTAAVSAGTNVTCLLGGGGGVECWGMQPKTYLGPPPGAFAQVSAGHDNTCALTMQGAIACWGSPATFLGPSPTGVYVQVTTGNGYACARTDAGMVTCWGWPHGGATNVPAGTFVDVAAGGQGACGREADGTVRCWGDPSRAPGDPAPGLRFAQISVGEGVACGVDEAGAVRCWGRVSGPLDEAPPGPHTSVSIGGRYACALGRDGEVRCWGTGERAQLAAPNGPFTSVSVAMDHACATRPSGAVWCWGMDHYGQSEPPETHLLADPALALRNGYGLATTDLARRWPSERLTIVKGGRGTVELTNSVSKGGDGLVFRDTVDITVAARPAHIVFEAEHDASPGFPLRALVTTGDPTESRYWREMTLAVEGGKLTWAVAGAGVSEAGVTGPLAWEGSVARIVTTMPQQLGAKMEIAWFDPEPRKRPDAVVGPVAAKLVCTGLEERTYGDRRIVTWAYTVYGAAGLSTDVYYVDEGRRLVEIGGRGGFLRMVREDLAGG